VLLIYSLFSLDFSEIKEYSGGGKNEKIYLLPVGTYRRKHIFCISLGGYKNEKTPETFITLDGGLYALYLLFYHGR
jgi:hypothetical protein